MALPSKNIEGHALLRLQLMNSNLQPAVGTNAATEIKWGFGTSRWQLGYQPTSGRSRGKRVNVAYWPLTSKRDVRSNVGSWRISGHDADIVKATFMTQANRRGCLQKNSSNRQQSERALRQSCDAIGSEERSDPLRSKIHGDAAACQRKVLITIRGSESAAIAATSATIDSTGTSQFRANRIGCCSQ
jgi:hypothetical protein